MLNNVRAGLVRMQEMVYSYITPFHVVVDSGNMLKLLQHCEQHMLHTTVPWLTHSFITTILHSFILGFGKRDVLSRRGGYFPISECYSDYECEYGMKCDPQFGFCIAVAGKQNHRN